MKTDDILLYGGVAAAVYFLFIKPRQVAPGVTQVGPVTHMLPPAPVNTPNFATTALTALTAAAPAIEKYLFQPNPQPQQILPAPVSDTGSQIETPPLTSELPVSAPQYAYQPITTDSYLQMFQNGDYPGAEMSGVNTTYEAARLGLY